MTKVRLSALETLLNDNKEVIAKKIAVNSHLCEKKQKN